MPAFSATHYGDWFRVFVPEDIRFVRPKTQTGRISKLVFDLASTCNMGCSYCFADRGQYGNHEASAPKLLTASTAIAVVEKVLENCSHVGHVKFFGGEPLLAIDAIAATCERFKRAHLDHELAQAPAYNIITNGTVFSDAIAAVLRDFGIRITISVDGPKDIHDAQRPFTNGKGTFDRISENITQFHRSGCRLGVLEAVFTPLHIEAGYSMLSLYKSLRESFARFFETVVVHPLDQPTLNQLPAGEGKERYVSEMRQQTRELYEYLLSTDVATKDRARFSGMMKMLTAETRDENLCGVGYDIITVKPDASVYSCYIFSADKSFKYGSILSDAFWDKFHNGGLFGVMDKASRFKHDACRACDINRVCSHCLSGMTSDAGLQGKLPDVNCDFFIGQIEGFFESLQEFASQGRFDELCNKVAK